MFIWVGLRRVRQIWWPFTARKLLHLRFLTEVSPGDLGHVGSLSWRGANFEIPSVTLSALWWACQIALFFAVVPVLIIKEILWRDLDKEVAQWSCQGGRYSYRDLAQGPCVEICCRDLESAYRDLVQQSPAKRPLIKSWCRVLAKRPLLEILCRDLAKRSLTKTVDIVYRELVQKVAQRSYSEISYSDLARRCFLENLYRDLA